MRRVVIVLLAIFFCGCTMIPMGPKFKAEEMPKDGSALVYVYRIGDVGQAVPHNMVLINGKKYAALSYREYDVLNLQPGSYTLDSAGFTESDQLNKKEITVKAGEIYYVAQSWEKTGGGCIVIGYSSNCNIKTKVLFYVQEGGDTPSVLYDFRRADPVTIGGPLLR